MNRRFYGNVRLITGLMACALLCVAIVFSPGAWAQSLTQSPDAGQEKRTSHATEHNEGEKAQNTNDSADDGAFYDHDQQDQPSKDCVVDASDGVSALRNTLFVCPIKVGDAEVSCTFMITDEVNHYVQVGTGAECALADMGATGDMVLPNSVIYENVSYTVTAVAHAAFANCEGITSTGLEANSSVRVIHSTAYASCKALQTTGLDYEQSGVAEVGGDAFGHCFSLKSTGLAGNTKITQLSASVFGCCINLESTGLEANTTITSVGNHAFDYSYVLKTTGLENPNSAVRTLGAGVFSYCTGLVSTGLDHNSKVSSIGEDAFFECNSLGVSDTNFVNAGDLVLNGADGQLSIGKNAFFDTKLQRIYIGSTLINPSFGEGALNLSDGQKIPVIYVPNVSPWTEMNDFTFGAGQPTTYSKSEGSLIVMDPHISDMKASRVEGTSDSALLSFTANHGFKTSVKHPEAPLGDYNATLTGTETGQMQEATCTIPTGAGLTPGPEELRASLDKFIYPLDAKAQDYNSFSGTALSCTLDPVTYTIAFVSNGASGTMDNQQVSYGRGEKLHPCAFSVDNMTFRHWSTDAQDKGPTNASYDNEALTDSIPPQQGVTLTLFAQWQIGLSIRSENDKSEALIGAKYLLSSSEKGDGIEGLSFDQAGQRPLSWPVTTDKTGTFSVYWLCCNTYYLSNVYAPAAYSCAKSPQQIDITVQQGKALIRVEGIALESFKDKAGCITIQFSKAPSLPSTGSIPTTLIQALGALVLITLGGVASRKLRRQGS